MEKTIVDTSREFFHEIIKPILEREFPEETAQTAFGVFGWGSEALKLDDAYSRDHHWGLRIDALMPEAVFDHKREAMLAKLGEQIPNSYQGYGLRDGHVAGLGIAPEPLGSFLKRTIGIDHPPRTDEDWLAIPEEDITHIINGEVWHDPLGSFTAIRVSFKQYYPEAVWLRRMAHWCRYFSGMGTYALKRALLRNNELYACIAFAKSIRLGIQLAFLLDRTYFPYDKWLDAAFRQLPRMAGPLCPVVDEAVKISTPWERKLALLNQMSDILDETMQKDGIIPPHPRFTGSESSGYRLMEHAYKEILARIPAQTKSIIPQWEQIYMEKYVVGYVDSLDSDHWLSLLNLSPAEP